MEWTNSNKQERSRVKSSPRFPLEQFGRNLSFAGINPDNWENIRSQIPELISLWNNYVSVNNETSFAPYRRELCWQNYLSCSSDHVTLPWLPVAGTNSLSWPSQPSMAFFAPYRSLPTYPIASLPPMTFALPPHPLYSPKISCLLQETKPLAAPYAWNRPPLPTCTRCHATSPSSSKRCTQESTWLRRWTDLTAFSSPWTYDSTPHLSFCSFPLPSFRL